MIGPAILILLSDSARAVDLAVRARHPQERQRTGAQSPAAGQPQLVAQKPAWVGFERMFLRAGLGRPNERFGLWLTLWGVAIALGYLLASWIGLLTMLLAPPLILRLYMSWRYHRRIKRMIEQLPQLLDYTVRSSSPAAP
jgi:tight adherence protein B